MNGMFAKTAGTEVRATKSVCAANPGCGTPCQKGGPELPGTPQMETAGCPLHR